MLKEIGIAYFVAPDGPHRFKIECDKDNSPDPLDRMSLIYRFNDVTERTGAPNMSFGARMSKNAAPYSQVEQVSVENHIDHVRACLILYQTDFKRTEIIVRQAAIDTIRHNRRKGDPSLTADILKLFIEVSIYNPGEEIDLSNLELTFNTDRAELVSQLDYLVDSGQLVSKIGNRVDVLRGVTVGDNRFRLSPTKRHEVLKNMQLSPAKSVRVFLSYNTKDKVLAGKVKQTLEELGRHLDLSVFLAHEDLKVSDDWRERILEEIEKCHAFIPLLTAKFRNSDWTCQEAGIAIARGKKIMPLMVPKRPFGFMNQKQGIQLDIGSLETACNQIIARLRHDV